MSDDNNHWKLENLFHSTLKTRAQPFFTIHCCQFTLKIDNIHGILWIQSLHQIKKTKKLFSRTKAGPTHRWRKKTQAFVLMSSLLLPIYFENRQYSRNSLDSEIQISKKLVFTHQVRADLPPIHFKNRQYALNSLDSKFQISKPFFHNPKQGRLTADAKSDVTHTQRLFWFY